jgi:hypothetical protein
MAARFPSTAGTGLPAQNFRNVVPTVLTFVVSYSIDIKTHEEFKTNNFAVNYSMAKNINKLL